MAAAELTETLVGGPIGAGSSKTGTGLVWGIYSATVATQNDWVIFEDFTEVHHVVATIDASGALNPATIDGTTVNKVVLTSATTGAVTILVVGTPAAST